MEEENSALASRCLALRAEVSALQKRGKASEKALHQEQAAKEQMLQARAREIEEKKAEVEILQRLLADARARQVSERDMVAVQFASLSDYMGERALSDYLGERQVMSPSSSSRRSERDTEIDTQRDTETSPYPGKSPHMAPKDWGDGGGGGFPGDSCDHLLLHHHLSPGWCRKDERERERESAEE